MLVAENTAAGGISTYVLLMALGLRAAGQPVTITAVWPKPDRWLEIEAHRAGLPLLTLAPERRLSALPAAALRLRQTIAETRPAVVHTQGHYGDITAVLAGGPSATVLTCHGLATPTGPGLRLVFALDRVLWHRLDALIANSADTRRLLLARGAPAGRIAVVHHGVVWEDGRLPDYLIAEPLPLRLPADQPILGYVGRLSKEKGADVLIDALALLRRQNRPFHAVIVGDGPEQSRIESAIAATGLSDAVTLTGTQTGPGRWLAASDIVVVPSRRESLGLTILEAMAHGRPVVASAVEGIPEIVCHGETGVLVPAGQPGALAAAIATLIDSPQTRARLAVGGLQAVRERHAIEGMAAATRAVYCRAGQSGTIVG